jgi:peptide/nickel transport system permease protein
VPLLVRRLADVPPGQKAAVAEVLASASDFEGRYPKFAPEAAPAASVMDEVKAADRKLASWWQARALRYTEISGFARFAWYSWTETRYARWLTAVVSFDFGESFVHRRPVIELLGERIPVTLLVQGVSIFLMFLLAVPLGVWAAAKNGTVVERGVTLGLFLLYAAPDFWLATLAVLYLHPPFPIDGIHSSDISMALRDGALAPWSWAVIADTAWHLILPVAVLTLGGVAVLSRYGRASMLEVLRQDYIRTARAKGLSERAVLFRHALRNAVLPLVTLFGALLPALIGGSVVVESIFNIPGMGLLAWEAAHHSDVPVAMAVVTLTALFTMAGYLLTDLLYALLDPRIRAA